MLTVNNLHKTYGDKKVLNSIAFSIETNEIIGLIGVSGSGKSTLARCIMGLEKTTKGDILWNGEALADRKVRRSAKQDIQIVFQDPRASLNPRWSVKQTIAEPLLNFGNCRSKKQLNKRIATLLVDVGLDVQFMTRYPHELSTGQCQRICLARALAPNPKLIVLDEALSALDVSTQAQILVLLKDLHRLQQVSYLFISHDIAVIAELCERVMVMNKGVIVEESTAFSLINEPKHPYTRSLLADTPDLPDFFNASEWSVQLIQ